MSPAPLEVVRSLHDAFTRGDRPAVRTHYSRDTEWDDRSLRPEGGIQRGIDDVTRHMDMWFEGFVNYRWEIERVLESGPDVVVIGRERGEAKRSGVPVDQRVALVHTVRDGLVVRTQVFREPADALEAAGLPPTLARES